MKKLEQLYEGKAKKVFATDDPNVVLVDYKDDATAFNGLKKGTIMGKGVINNRVTNFLMKMLEKNGIPTHYIEEISDRETLVKKVHIVPLEVIVRNIAAGSLSKRLGLPEGTKLKQTVLEYCYKDDELGDPMVNEYHIMAMGWVSKPVLDQIAAYALRINELLTAYLKEVNIELIDFKLEFGITNDGQLVLADEINRTSPKTQSALLEVMEEQQVTVDGVTHPVPQPFIVLATQNPGEFVGTYPLPEAQMDRFFLRLSIGYPTIEQEMDVLERYSGVVKPMATLSPVCSAADVIAMQEMVTQIYCSPEVRSYVATIAAATRQDAALQLGASTRAAIALIHGAQACALLAGRDYIVPEDVQHMAVQVLAHRLVLSPEARMKGVTPESVVRRIVQNTPVPVKL